jgi:hypothetical protein
MAGAKKHKKSGGKKNPPASLEKETMAQGEGGGGQELEEKGFLPIDPSVHDKEGILAEASIILMTHTVYKIEYLETVKHIFASLGYDQSTEKEKQHLRIVAANVCFMVNQGNPGSTPHFKKVFEFLYEKGAAAAYFISRLGAKQNYLKNFCGKAAGLSDKEIKSIPIDDSPIENYSHLMLAANVIHKLLSQQQIADDEILAALENFENPYLDLTTAQKKQLPESALNILGRCFVDLAEPDVFERFSRTVETMELRESWRALIKARLLIDNFKAANFEVCQALAAEIEELCNPFIARHDVIEKDAQLVSAALSKLSYCYIQSGQVKKGLTARINANKVYQENSLIDFAISVQNLHTLTNNEEKNYYIEQFVNFIENKALRDKLSQWFKVGVDILSCKDPHTFAAYEAEKISLSLLTDGVPELSKAVNQAFKLNQILFYAVRGNVPQTMELLSALELDTSIHGPIKLGIKINTLYLLPKTLEVAAVVESISEVKSLQDIQFMAAIYLDLSEKAPERSIEYIARAAKLLDSANAMFCSNPEIFECYKEQILLSNVEIVCKAILHGLDFGGHFDFICEFGSADPELERFLNAVHGLLEFQAQASAVKADQDELGPKELEAPQSSTLPELRDQQKQDEEPDSARDEAVAVDESETVGAVVEEADHQEQERYEDWAE